MRIRLLCCICLLSQGIAAAEEPVVPPEVMIDEEAISDLDRDIVFDHGDDLWLLGRDGSLTSLTGTGEVFSFTCDDAAPGLILFSSLDEDLDMHVYAMWKDDLNPEQIGIVENEAELIDFFVTSTYGERAQMWVEGDQLKIECDFQWDWYGFTDTAVIDLAPVRGAAGPIRESQPENDGIFIENRMIGDHFDLMCSIGDTTYRLTDTDSITRFDDYYLEEPLSFDLSPAGNKVLFCLITDFGDLAHGPMLIVNIDGSGQQQLLSDMNFWNFFYEWAGENLLYIGFYTMTSASDLCLVSGHDNIPQLVIMDVNHFEVME